MGFALLQAVTVGLAFIALVLRSSLLRGSIRPQSA
jgi:hypothetical protein